MIVITALTKELEEYEKVKKAGNKNLEKQDNKENIDYDDNNDDADDDDDDDDDDDFSVKRNNDDDNGDSDYD